MCARIRDQSFYLFFFYFWFWTQRVPVFNFKYSMILDQNSLCLGFLGKPRRRTRTRKQWANEGAGISGVHEGRYGKFFLSSPHMLSHTRLSAFFQVNRILKWGISSLSSSYLTLEFCEMG